ncbi:MAG: hypothetical protein ACTS8H_03570 [Arsenophonus sp. NC-PE1-MAG3]
MYNKDYSLAALGYVVELHDAGNYLFEQIKKAHRVLSYIVLTKLFFLSAKIEYVSVKLTSNKVLTRQLLVATDGSDFMIGKVSQIEWHQVSY